jgi:hypothetical protein
MSRGDIFTFLEMWTTLFAHEFSLIVSILSTSYVAFNMEWGLPNNLSAKSWLKLYNSMIAPILTYGSEVWITDFKPNFEVLEKTQNMIIKISLVFMVSLQTQQSDVNLVYFHLVLKVID